MFCFFFYSTAIIAVLLRNTQIYIMESTSTLLCVRIGRRFLVDIETVCQSHNHVTGPQRKSDKKEKIKFL